MPAVSVIGIGNTLMGDDGVGVRIAEKLAGQLQGATVVTGHMAGMSLMPAVMSAEVVIFVDAVAVGEEAGAIYRFDPDEAGVTGLRSTTSHGMGIPYLVTNARLQGHFPRFIVYAVHIGDIMLGPDALSPKVDAAVPRICELISDEVALLQAATA